MKNINQLVSIVVLFFLGITTVLLSNAAKFEEVVYELIIQKPVIAQTVINMDVDPGGLSQSIEYDLSSPTEIQMSAVDISIAPPTGADSTGELRTVVKDHRGTAVGWTQTLSSTDFDDGSGNIVPVTNFTVTPSLVEGIGASDSTGIVLGPSHTFASTLDVMPLATAPVGFGSGRHRITNDLLLHIDKTTVPGSYSATVTITIS